MPRIKTTITTAERRKQTSGRFYRRGTSDWQDPFPDIQGTTIEKMIYARLVAMGVRFIFQGDLKVSLPELGIFKTYRPDFILPDVKIIIDPFGSFWHSTNEAIEADAYKFALFEAMGYKVVVWWDYEILTYGLDVLIARVPELNRYKPKRVQYGGRPPRNRNMVDDTKGIRTLNAKRRAGRIILRPRRSIRKARRAYATR